MQFTDQLNFQHIFSLLYAPMGIQVIGGSAAQSSILPCFDAVLGIKHDEGTLLFACDNYSWTSLIRISEIRLKCQENCMNWVTLICGDFIMNSMFR